MYKIKKNGGSVHSIRHLGGHLRFSLNHFLFQPCGQVKVPCLKLLFLGFRCAIEEQINKSFRLCKSLFIIIHFEHLYVYPHRFCVVLRAHNHERTNWSLIVHRRAGYRNSLFMSVIKWGVL